MQKEVNLKSLHPKEEKNMTKPFHIGIQINKIKVESLFHFSSYAKLIGEYLVSKIGLEAHDHPHPYWLGWINKDVELIVLK